MAWLITTMYDELDHQIAFQGVGRVALDRELTETFARFRKTGGHDL